MRFSFRASYLLDDPEFHNGREDSEEWSGQEEEKEEEEAKKKEFEWAGGEDTLDKRDLEKHIELLWNLGS